MSTLNLVLLLILWWGGIVSAINIDAKGVSGPATNAEMLTTPEWASRPQVYRPNNGYWGLRWIRDKMVGRTWYEIVTRVVTRKGTKLLSTIEVELDSTYRGVHRDRTLQTFKLNGVDGLQLKDKHDDYLVPLFASLRFGYVGWTEVELGAYKGSDVCTLYTYTITDDHTMPVTVKERNLSCGDWEKLKPTAYATPNK